MITKLDPAQYRRTPWKNGGLPADRCLHIAADQPTMLACGLGVIVLGSITCVSRS